MRILSIIGAVFIFGLIFFSFEGSSETYHFDNLTVGKDETRIFHNDVLWVQGDILVDGLLTIENCSLNINRTLDLTIPEIRINSTGALNLSNISVTGGNTFFTLVSDSGDLNILNTDIDYGMLWLVGGNATVSNLILNGFSMINYGIFSEDTNLTATNVHIQNYTLGLRSIGTNPTLDSISYYNCTTRMTQEWWITFSAFEESTSLPIVGFEVRQWDGGKMVGSWNWAKQYEINSQGEVVSHIANFTSYLNLDFAYIEDQWNQEITENTHFVRKYDLNTSNISYQSAIIFVDDDILGSGQIVPKWSVINVSVVVDNPTDMNFNNLYLDLAVNGESGFARTSLELLAGDSLRMNLTWMASVEGPLSLGVSTVVVDYSGNLTDTVISLSKFIEVETSSSNTKDSGAWGAFLAIFMLLCLCCYIVYNDMEEYDSNIDIEDNSSVADEDVEERSEAEITDDMEEE